ncbi:hypothetical protein [Ruminococcus sp.]|uniref:hypothetical protein n=1 Tax=Ruminococcus sp. TaxID=41978 RepID=UPI003AF9AA9E
MKLCQEEKHKSTAIITDYAVTETSVQDSQRYSDLFNENDKIAYADSAYIGQEIPEQIFIR